MESPAREHEAVLAVRRGPGVPYTDAAMYDELSYRVTLLIVAFVQGALSRRYVKRAQAGATLFQKRAEGLPLALALGSVYAGYCLAVLVYLLNPAWMAWAALPLPAVARWIGAVIMASGAALHLWGMHHLGKNLTISISTRQGHALVTTGPYRWVRHPLYSGGMLESIGVCLLLANGAVTLSALFFWALIVWRTPREEAELLRVFGQDYSEYAIRTGRFLPRPFR